MVNHRPIYRDQEKLLFPAQHAGFYFTFKFLSTRSLPNNTEIGEIVPPRTK
jgi:hypothetical protein